MRVGSLFAGIGGFDLAAERVGMEVAWQSEIDPKASAVLAHHWPGVRNYGDIHDIRIPMGSRQRRGEFGHRTGIESHTKERNDTRDLASESNGTIQPSAVDVLTGGFPCQDYSVAGTRGGLAGDRGALWWEYHRLIAGLRPTWVIGENVPGLLSSRGGRDFETIVGSLTELGYGVAWAVLDAQYFGVAQRRRRVFIVGHSGGEPRPEVLAVGEGLFGHPEPRREAGERTAPTLAARTRGGGWPGTDEALDGAVISSLTASHSYDQVGNEDRLILGFNWQANSFAADLGAKSTHIDSLHAGQVPAVLEIGDGRARPRRIEPIMFEDDRRTGPRMAEGVVPTLPARMGEGGNNMPMVFAQNQRDEVRDLGDKAGALAAEPGMKQQTYDTSPASVRRLTPLECERLQGFPDGWTATPGNSDTQRYRQLGNAVAVPVVEWILGNIQGVV